MKGLESERLTRDNTQGTDSRERLFEDGLGHERRRKPVTMFAFQIWHLVAREDIVATVHHAAPTARCGRGLTGAAYGDVAPALCKPRGEGESDMAPGARCAVRAWRLPI